MLTTSSVFYKNGADVERGRKAFLLPRHAVAFTFLTKTDRLSSAYSVTIKQSGYLATTASLAFSASARVA